jgi:hypothetical protein
MTVPFAIAYTLGGGLIASIAFDKSYGFLLADEPYKNLAKT